MLNSVKKHSRNNFNSYEVTAMFYFCSVDTTLAKFFIPGKEFCEKSQRSPALTIFLDIKPKHFISKEISKIIKMDEVVLGSVYSILFTRSEF